MSTETDHAPGSPRAQITIIDILLLIFAVILLMQYDRSLHPRAIGIDLYQYWGVGQVIRTTDGEIRNPYKNRQDFNRILSAMGASADDPAHKSVAEFRKDLELQATPFSYFLFSWLPSNYNLTRVLYRYLQMGLFVCAVFVILRACGFPWWTSLLTGLILIQISSPLFSELGVGNFNTILMAGLTGTIFIADRLAFRPLPRRNETATICTAALLLTCLSFLALMKPTLIAIVAAFQVFLLARFGIRITIKANLLAILPAGLMAVLPAIRFGSADIWLEWFHYFMSGNLNMFSLPVEKGNLSLTLFISRMLHISQTACMLIIAVILFFSFAINGIRAKRIRAHLADPHFALVWGVIAALGLFPLAWLHYFLLLLVPGFILLHPRHRGTDVPKLAMLSVVMATPNIPELFPYTMMLSWIPLWLAGLKIEPARNNTIT